MPTSPRDKTVEGGHVVHLHSVHFIGTITTDSDPNSKRTNTDVCSELRSMSVVMHSDKSCTCFALANVKVTNSQRGRRG